MTDAFAPLNTALAGRYRVDRELGQGGMATVYLAEDLKHGRRVAVKVLLPELAAAVGHDRFLREITTTANLRHPHILPLYDSGEAGGSVYYVMPFAEGETLRDRLDREKQLPLEDALRIAAEVADALGYAHARGIVHRDVKPENVLLSGRSAVVTDFGIAKAAERPSQTLSGALVGTPAYMSPEQCRGGEISWAADQYALGAVAYEMVTGAPLFDGSTFTVLQAQVELVDPR